MRSTFTSLAVAAIVAAAPAAFAQDKVLFKTPTTFNTELPGLGTPLPRVAEAIDVLQFHAYEYEAGSSEVVDQQFSSP